MNQLGLIDFQLCENRVEITPQIEYLGVVINQGLVVFREQKKSKVKLLEQQSEFPILAVVWAIDVIEIGFGRSPDEGGLPRDVLHAETVIDGEKIYLRRTMNCGAPQQQGYTLKNFSRNSYIDVRNTQSIQLPDELLFDKGLLQKLKDLVNYSSR